MVAVVLLGSMLLACSDKDGPGLADDSGDGHGESDGGAGDGGAGDGGTGDGGAGDGGTGDGGTGDCTDNDGDGFSPDGGDCGEIDCWDSMPTFWPGAPEYCWNPRFDHDCDGLRADLDPDSLPQVPAWLDHDGDGHGAGEPVGTTSWCAPAAGLSLLGDDCDDADGSRHPTAAEVCDNGIDDDCDGRLDCEDGECHHDAACAEDCSNGSDDDGDGHTDCDDPACADAEGCEALALEVRLREARVRRWHMDWSGSVVVTRAYYEWIRNVSLEASSARLWELEGTMRFQRSPAAPVESCTFGLQSAQALHSDFVQTSGTRARYLWDQGEIWAAEGCPVPSQLPDQGVVHDAGLIAVNALPTRPGGYTYSGYRWWGAWALHTTHATAHSTEWWDDGAYSGWYTGPLPAAADFRVQTGTLVGASAWVPVE